MIARSACVALILAALHCVAAAQDSKPIAEADSVIAVFTEPSARPESKGPQLILGVWGDGTLVWSNDNLQGGPPYQTAQIQPKIISDALKKITDLGAFDIPKLNQAHFGPDSSFTTILVRNDGKELKMQSWHELYESNGKTVATARGITGLDGRKLLPALAEQPADHLHYRMTWLQLRLLAANLIPKSGKETNGVPKMKQGKLSWQAKGDSIIRKSDDELSSKSWGDIVHYYLQEFEKPNDPVSKAYTDRLRTLFKHPGVSLIRSYSIVDGNKSEDENIYYRAGELHVVGAAVGKEGKPSEWNLLVRDRKAYEWRTGETKGIESKAIDKDMIDYLIYLTDAALISTSIHEEFLRHPESFDLPKISKDDGWIELKKTRELSELRISALFVGDDPFWIYGFEMKPKGSVIRLIHERPEPVDKLPDDLFAPLEKIEFKKSQSSLRRHLIFL